MKKIFLILLMVINNYGLEVDSTIEENPFLNSNDEFISGNCQPTCRAVKDGYMALVVNFDAKNGKTYCNVYRTNDLTNPTGYKANTTNSTCYKKTNQKVEYESLASYNKDFKNVSTIEYEPNQLTLTRFLAGLVTLDPEIVDFKTTNTTGQLQLKDPTVIYGTNTTDIKTDKQLIATSDNLNKANLAYYSNLYSDLSKIYTALQYMLLVVIGGYFFAVYASRNLLNKVEKNDHQNKVLNTLFIPVVVLATFFIPIPESSGMNGTIVQKVTRTAASQSNYFADKVGAIGSKSYTQKLYSSVGAFSVDGEKTLRENQKNYEVIKNIYQKAYKECGDRFPNVKNFMDQSANNYFNVNKIGEKYTFLGCQNIEHEYLSYISLIRQNNALLNALENNLKNERLRTVLTQINNATQIRQNELGWINSTIMPGMAVMIDKISIIEDNDIARIAQDENKDIKEQTSQEMAYKNQREQGSIIDFKNSEMGEIVGNLTYLILPGAGDVLNYNSEIISSGLVTVSGLVGMIPVIGDGLSEILKSRAKIIGKTAGLPTTIIMYKNILEYIPLTVSIVASALAFLAYIIELAKYFYITPFVTAFSLSTGSSNKIVNFLVEGISLFVRPILIVLFIYFAMFIFGLFKDVFLIYSIEQMSFMREVQDQFFLSMAGGIFSVVLEIVGVIGATYIMWKIIMQGPSWVMKMIGLNESSANFVTEAVGQRLERYSFQL